MLKTNSQNKPQLDISVIARVQNDVTVDPRFVYFGVIDTSKEGIDPNSLRRAVIVSSARGDDVSLEKVESSAGWIVVEEENNQKGEKCSIIIKLDENRLPKGQFKEKIKIHTKRKKISEVADVIIEGKVL